MKAFWSANFILMMSGPAIWGSFEWDKAVSMSFLIARASGDLSQASWMCSMRAFTSSPSRAISVLMRSRYSAGLISSGIKVLSGCHGRSKIAGFAL